MATAQKRIFNDVTQTVGRTPIVRLNNRLAVDGTELLLKLEYYNPTASVKDRLSVGAINFAEKSGNCDQAARSSLRAAETSESGWPPQVPAAVIASS